jgi:hypothetical protein
MSRFLVLGALFPAIPTVWGDNCDDGGDCDHMGSTNYMWVWMVVGFVCMALLVVAIVWCLRSRNRPTIVVQQVPTPVMRTHYTQPNQQQQYPNGSTTYATYDEYSATK